MQTLFEEYEQVNATVLEHLKMLEDKQIVLKQDEEAFLIRKYARDSCELCDCDELIWR